MWQKRLHAGCECSWALSVNLHVSWYWRMSLPLCGLHGPHHCNKLTAPHSPPASCTADAACAFVGLSDEHAPAAALAANSNGNMVSCIFNSTSNHAADVACSHSRLRLEQRRHNDDEPSGDHSDPEHYVASQDADSSVYADPPVPVWNSSNNSRGTSRGADALAGSGSGGGGAPRFLHLNDTALTAIRQVRLSLSGHANFSPQTNKHGVQDTGGTWYLYVLPFLQ